MPPVSQKQRAAMWAAASGKSTLGIPRKVGAEFAKADPGGKLPARARKQAAAPPGSPVMSRGGKFNPDSKTSGGMLGPNKRIARKAK
jgi:hypothetical protein